VPQRELLGQSGRLAEHARDIERSGPRADRAPWGSNMTVKEIAIKTIQQLPEDATWEDVQERINFVGGVRQGLRELNNGTGISHENLKEEFREWLSS
jgi:hypothetical protein